MSIRELLLAFSLGLAFSAPPGIVTAESIRRGLGGGFWSAVSVGFGSLIGDTFYAIITLKDLATFTSHRIFTVTTGFAGVGVLFFLALSALKARLPNRPYANTPKDQRGAFLSGAVLSLTNPWAIAFWVGFGGTLFSSGIQSANTKSIPFLIVFLAGSMLWFIVLSVLIAFGRKFVTPRLFRAASIAASFIFASTGIYTIWRLTLL